MKPSLQLKLSQHLTLTPQLQQSIKLLQLSTLELNQEIERFLLENPMLEREEIDDFVPQPGLATSTPPAERERERERESSAEAAGDGEAGKGAEREDNEEGIDWSNVGTGASRPLLVALARSTVAAEPIPAPYSSKVRWATGVGCASSSTVTGEAP